ncbi:MAG: hypothetical protein GY727_00585 [Gammaproteobacteria bacterium]|nr:hypothetical protein [Gammaproteobacteria bacterium]MCP4090963.1 hypothetical protein [Gammaproteobacteria bacterium]MCP4275266.1 hypothetical protein [Gammaproteobacteria bacterium]MCP4929392.1 hypothetical protein [Gammaproteobacteria bacterium]
MAYITDIVSTTPLSTDPVSQGDDQIRQLKLDVQQSFPNIDAEVSLTAAELNGAIVTETAREAAAGVTVVDATFRPGDVRRYGAVAGEAADTTASVNTAAIQAALDSNGYVWFQPGETYMTGTVFPDSNQVIDLNGATLMLLKDMPFQSAIIHMSAESRYTADVWYRAGIFFLDRVTLKNGTLNGNLINNLTPWSEPGTYGSSGASGDGGMNGITLRGTTTNIRLENIVSKECWTDGAAFSHSVNGDGGVQQYVTFLDVDCDSNGRQGCSIVKGSDYTFTRCKFRNTNASSTNGWSEQTAANTNFVQPAGPWAGVDVEPEGGSDINNLRFTDCEFTGNAGKGFLGALKSNSVGDNWYFEGCYVWANNNGLPNANGGGNRGMQFGAFTGVVKNAVLNNCVMDVFGIGDNSNTEVHATLTGCTLGDKDAPYYGVWCQGNGNVERGSLNFSGCIISANRDDNSTGPVIIGTPNLDVTFSGGSVINYSAVGGRAMKVGGNGSTLTVSGVRVRGFEGIRTGSGSNHTAIIGGGTHVIANTAASGTGLMAQSNSGSGSVMRVGECTVEGFAEGIGFSGGGNPDLQVNGAECIDCTVPFPDGVTLISEMRGNYAPTMGAPNGSIFNTLASNGTLYFRNTGIWKVVQTA